MGNFDHCKWFFADAPVNQDLGPNDAKFEIFKPDINSLVRESIQNSMDAVDDDSIPVRMSFKIKSIKKNDYPRFFDLKDHIEGCVKYWGKDAKDVFSRARDTFLTASSTNRIHYIEVSDYNTSGMDYERGNNKTRFHGFLHSTGASNRKKANSGGSFGIGKAAYFAMSPLRTIIVSTMTQEGDYTFQGIANLCTHEMPNGNLKTPIGFFGSHNEHPITLSSEIPPRFLREEPGTSINIMGIKRVSPLDDCKIYEEMKMAVLRNFWLAIYNDRLDVEIGEETIDSSNVKELVEYYFPDLSDNKRKGNVNPRPYLEVVSNVAEDDKVYILKKAKLPNLGEVKFYIYRSPEGRGTIQYFRMPNMMVKREKWPSANNFFGVFICDNPEGDVKLKKLETVEHNDWEPKNWKPREVDGSVSKEARAIMDELDTFIRESIDSAFGNNTQDTMEILGMDKYLYIPTASENDILSSSEALMSEPTGEFKNSGPSPTSVLEEQPVISIPILNPSPAKGKVFVGKAAKAKYDEKGDLYSGRGKRLKPKNPDPHIIPGSDRRNQEQEDGIEGNFSREVDVTYRGIAQKENGEYYHYLKINSPETVENGRIIIATGREYGGSEPLNIIESSLGRINRNSITDLTLRKGSNTLIIKFADNLRHTLTLEVYEDKY